MFAAHLLGTLINGLKPVSNQQQNIELQPGQVFRGVIMRAYPNDMVQIQLAGTTLIAQLSAPLEVGQQAWLQVLPRSHPITLKVIDAPRTFSDKSGEHSEIVGQSSIAALLRGLGIKADRVNMNNLKQLMDAGIPLKSGELNTMLDLLRGLPNTDRTLLLFQMAHQRGLPISQEVIMSLETILFGKSIGNLLEEIKQFASENRQAASLLERANVIWQEATTQLSNWVTKQHVGKDNSSMGVSQSPSLAMPNRSDQVLQSISPILSSNKSDHSLGFEDNSPVRSTIQTEILVDKGPLPQQDKGPMTFFKLLGIDYESLVHSKYNPLNEQSIPNIKTESLNQLKGVLLELRGLENLSTPFREAIDHGIRMITGQQLLLVNDNNSPWNSFVFQIPLPHMDREASPSYIHIEGRKKGREAIDIENCRLFFHLELEAIDTTMIDIQVTNRIMGIQIYNDFPWIKEWVEQYREEWTESMRTFDYHLSSIKVQPLANVERNRENSPTTPVQRTTYQGVDFRV